MPMNTNGLPLSLGSREKSLGISRMFARVAVAQDTPDRPAVLLLPGGGKGCTAAVPSGSSLARRADLRSGRTRTVRGDSGRTCTPKVAASAPCRWHGSPQFARLQETPAADASSSPRRSLADVRAAWPGPSAPRRFGHGARVTSVVQVIPLAWDHHTTESR